MFRRRTTFILGAGASKELGFPLGTMLAELIGQRVETSDNGLQVTGPGTELLRALHSKIPLRDAELFETVTRLKRGIFYSKSIDDFLQQHQDNQAVVLLGKLAIARELLAAEATSILRRTGPPDNISNSLLAGSWLIDLARMILRGQTRSTVQSLFENTRFISFNYDRSLERFFVHAITEALSLNADEVWPIVKGAKIFHAYGSLGNLPGESQKDTVAYGAERLDGQALVRIADRISTYSETVSDSSLLNGIKGAMDWAEQIVFLGFGFHEQNMLLLKPDEGLSRKTVIGTVKDMSPVAIQTASSLIYSLFDTNVVSEPEVRRELALHNEGCAEFFRTYSITLPS